MESNQARALNRDQLIERLNKEIEEHKQNIWDFQVEIEELKVKITDEEDNLKSLYRLLSDITSNKPLSV